MEDKVKELEKHLDLVKNFPTEENMNVFLTQLEKYFEYIINYEYKS